MEEEAREQPQRPHVPRLRESPRDRHFQARGLKIVPKQRQTDDSGHSCGKERWSRDRVEARTALALSSQRLKIVPGTQVRAPELGTRQQENIQQKVRGQSIL